MMNYIILDGNGSNIDLGLNGTINRITLNTNSTHELYTGGLLNGDLWSTKNDRSRGKITINNFSASSNSNFNSLQFEDTEVSMPASLLNAYRGGSEIEIYGADISFSGSLTQKIYFRPYNGTYTNTSCVKGFCSENGDMIQCSGTTCSSY